MDGLMLRFLRSPRSLAAAAAAVVLAACASDPLATAPEMARRNEVLPNPVAVKVLARVSARPTFEKASLTITATKGGTLTLPASGLTVTVPAGAIKSGTLTITASADPGKLVSYDFQPHGTVFLKPLTLTQALNVTTWNSTWTGTLSGAYIPGLVDFTKGVATASELFPITIATDRKTGKSTASWQVWHFSGYVITTGRDGDPNANSLGM
jgi:hypothetical protein